MQELLHKHCSTRNCAEMERTVLRLGESSTPIWYSRFVLSQCKLIEWSQKNQQHIREQLQSMGGLLNWKEEVVLHFTSQPSTTPSIRSAKWESPMHSSNCSSRA